MQAFRATPRPVSEVPALIARESAEDVGLVTIGPKGYGYRSYPGNLTCRRVVRLFTDNGFGGESYDVSFHSDRPALCTCADFVFRRKDQTGETCRHIRGVVALGLDQSPAVTVDEVEKNVAALVAAVAALVNRS